MDIFVHRYTSQGTILDNHLEMHTIDAHEWEIEADILGLMFSDNMCIIFVYK